MPDLAESLPDWLAYDLHPVAKRFHTRLSAIKLLMLDVDGVLTDGTLLYGPDGEAYKPFNTHDGQGLTLLPQFGIATGVLTARQSVMVSRRAQDLGMSHVYQAAKPKWPVLKQLLDTLGLAPAAVAYMGDDWPDTPVLQQVGFAACPVDAIPAVQRQCHWVSPFQGGKGAVRSVCDLLLAINGFKGI